MYSFIIYFIITTSQGNYATVQELDYNLTKEDCTHLLEINGNLNNAECVLNSTLK